MSSQSNKLGMQENSESGCEHTIGGNNVTQFNFGSTVMVALILGMDTEPKHQLETTQRNFEATSKNILWKTFQKQ